jgi:hypothetical protein
VAESCLVDVAGELLQDLGGWCRDGPRVLAQLGRGVEGIRCYRRSRPSVSGAPRVPIVLVARHLRRSLWLVWLVRRALVCIGRRIGHRNWSCCLNNRCEYLSHRRPRRYGDGQLDRDRLVLVDGSSGDFGQARENLQATAALAWGLCVGARVTHHHGDGH